MDQKALERLKNEVQQYMEDRGIKDSIEYAMEEVQKVMQNPFYESPCENCWACADKINGEPNWKMFYCRHNS